jgi:hypothetical protein
MPNGREYDISPESLDQRIRALERVDRLRGEIWRDLQLSDMSQRQRRGLSSLLEWWTRRDDMPHMIEQATTALYNRAEEQRKAERRTVQLVAITGGVPTVFVIADIILRVTGHS